jgi:hypothetical protein
MRVFKNRWFTRFASKEGISDKELRDVVNNVLETGQSDADLGGGVYKIRVARPGKGKADGYRIIVFFRSGFLTFYVYGFAKSDRGNINRKELAKLKKQAKTLLAMTDKSLTAAVNAGVFEEIVEDI